MKVSQSDVTGRDDHTDGGRVPDEVKLRNGGVVEGHFAAEDRGVGNV